MTAQEFNTINFEQKSALLTENSIFIDERFIYGKYKILMYSLFNFYVEVYYHIEHNEIETVKALVDLKDWESYMSSIQLELLN